jgi:hypothetical protein
MGGFASGHSPVWLPRHPLVGSAAGLVVSAEMANTKIVLRVRIAILLGSVKRGVAFH